MPSGTARSHRRTSVRTTSPKKCPRPRSAVGNCSDRYIRTAGKHDSTVNPVISAPALNTIVAAEPVTMRHHHQQQAGYRQHKRTGDRPAPADDLHDEAVEQLAGDAGSEHQRAQSKAQGDGGTLTRPTLSAAGSRSGNRPCRAQMPHRMPTAVHRNWPGANNFQNGGNCSRMAVHGRFRARPLSSAPPGLRIAGSIRFTCVDRVLRPAAAQQPARALGDQEIDQHRGDEQGDPTRQPDQTGSRLGWSAST